MKNLFICLFTVLTVFSTAQTFKSKSVKLKCTTPEGWNVTEFGGKTSWDESGNDLCKCSGLLFVKEYEGGKLKVLIYPSTVNGLDSTKRNMVGNLRFENVEKYDKTRNKAFSFEKRKSYFYDTKTNKKSFEVIKYKTKNENHFYIIYAWHENMQMMSPDIEKELFEVVNAIEPL